MILFKKDWANYPNAVVHVNTTNKTWLKMAIIYRDFFKLDNWAFCLSLLDPDLKDIDPLDPDLSDSIKLKIIHECNRNPWYFYREILRIPAKSGIGNAQFRTDRGTIATLFCYHNHIDTTNIQLRQTGKTIKIEAVACWLLTCGTFNSTILYGTVDSGKQRDTVKNLKNTLRELPDYIYTPIKGKDYDNGISVSNVSRKNYIEFAIGQKDKAVANRNGRGYALANKIFDEVAETANADVSISAATGASNAVRYEAKSKGEPYGTIFACTAGSLDVKEGLYYFNLAKSGMRWDECLLDCVDWDDLFKMVGVHSNDPLAPLVDITMSYRQLGIPEERFREIVAMSRREANGDEDKVNRECYSRWSRGGVSNPLTKEQIKVITAGEQDPIRRERTKERYSISWYVSEERLMQIAENSRISIGLDTSNAVNADACALTFKDMATMEVLGRLDIKSTNLFTYGLFIAEMILRIPNSILVIENKSSGQGIIDACILKLHNNGEDPFKRMFNRVYQEPDKYSRQLEEINNTPLSRRTVEWYDKYKGLFGFMTTSTLRQMLYSRVLTDAIKLGGGLIRDKELAEQLRVLEERNNRVDHPKGGNDDAVISYLLSCWFCLFGRNFKRYNIPGRLPLSLTVRTEDGGHSEEDFAKQEELNYLYTVLPELEASYKKNHGTMYGYSITKRIEVLLDRIEALGGEPKSLEGLLEEIRKRRK